jgi:hypothetical protein
MDSERVEHKDLDMTYFQVKYRFEAGGVSYGPSGYGEYWRMERFNYYLGINGMEVPDNGRSNPKMY